MLHGYMYGYRIRYDMAYGNTAIFNLIRILSDTDIGIDTTIQYVSDTIRNHI